MRESASPLTPIGAPGLTMCGAETQAWRAGKRPQKQQSLNWNSNSPRTHFLTPMYVRNETSVEWSDAARGVSITAAFARADKVILLQVASGP